MACVGMISNIFVNEGLLEDLGCFQAFPATSAHLRQQTRTATTWSIRALSKSREYPLQSKGFPIGPCYWAPVILVGSVL